MNYVRRKNQQNINSRTHVDYYLTGLSEMVNTLLAFQTLCIILRYHVPHDVILNV